MTELEDLLLSAAFPTARAAEKGCAKSNTLAASASNCSSWNPLLKVLFFRSEFPHLQQTARGGACGLQAWGLSSQPTKKTSLGLQVSRLYSAASDLNNKP